MGLIGGYWYDRWNITVQGSLTIYGPSGSAIYNHSNSSITLLRVELNIIHAHSIWSPVTGAIKTTFIPDLPSKLETIAQFTSTIHALRTALLATPSSLISPTKHPWPWYKIYFMTILVLLVLLACLTYCVLRLRKQPFLCCDFSDNTPPASLESINHNDMPRHPLM